MKEKEEGKDEESCLSLIATGRYLYRYRRNDAVPEKSGYDPTDEEPSPAFQCPTEVVLVRTLDIAQVSIVFQVPNVHLAGNGFAIRGARRADQISPLQNPLASSPPRKDIPKSKGRKINRDRPTYVFKTTITLQSKSSRSKCHNIKAGRLMSVSQKRKK